MTILAGSLYLVCTAAFALLSLVIGVRMIGLSRKTRENPEFLLGMGLILTAAVGYGMLTVAGVMRPTADDPYGELATAMRDDGLSADAVLRRYCTLVYERSGSLERAARHLGLDRRTVRAKLQR